jgi:hypothetical protein
MNNTQQKPKKDASLSFRLPKKLLTQLRDMEQHTGMALTRLVGNVLEDIIRLYERQGQKINLPLELVSTSELENLRKQAADQRMN